MVDTDSKITVHTVVHLGKIAKDVVDVAKSTSKTIAAVAVAPDTMGASLTLALRFFKDVVMAGSSIPREMSSTLNDIAHYYNEGHLIVTLGPESNDVDDWIHWLVLGN